MRAADNDREAVVALLTQAQTEGRLDLDEFDERVRLVWLARTYDELAALTGDLPPHHAIVPVHTRVPEPEPVYQVERREPGKVTRFLVRLWIANILINFTIWGIICLSNLEWFYPWWLWVLGPPGALFLAARITRFGLPR
jgi:hypothetical protein